MAPNLKAFTGQKWYVQIGIVAAICGIGLGAAWYFYFSPMGAQITEKEGQLTTLQQEIAKSLQQKKTFEAFKAQTIELGKKLDELKLVLPLDKETDQIIKSIQSEAVGSGVRIMTIVLRPSIDHEVYTEWPWTLEVVGTYNTIASFFDKIRRLPRIVNVTTLKVSSRATEGELAFTASVGSTFTATTFIYKDEPIATSAPPAKPAK